jgi:hypothetical protein
MTEYGLNLNPQATKMNSTEKTSFFIYLTLSHTKSAIFGYYRQQANRAR